MFIQLTLEALSILPPPVAWKAHPDWQIAIYDFNATASADPPTRQTASSASTNTRASAEDARSLMVSDANKVMSGANMWTNDDKRVLVLYLLA